MPDYIPSRDADALIWFATLDTFTTANGVANGMSAPQVAAFTTAVAEFSASMTDLDAAENALQAAVQTKKAKRAGVERQARLARQFMNPNLDNTERAAA